MRKQLVDVNRINYKILFQYSKFKLYFKVNLNIEILLDQSSKSVENTLFFDPLSGADPDTRQRPEIRLDSPTLL